MFIMVTKLLGEPAMPSAIAIAASSPEGRSSP